MPPVRRKKLHERTVFDGIHPDEKLSWDVVFAWERTLSEIDAEIASWLPHAAHT